MVEKLPLDFVRKIYTLLTTGNDDVNFYCMCVQNQNREAATNSPIKFALNLIKINILCRLPFKKGKIFSEEIGKSYLSQFFVRPAICELASGMLDNSQLIVDISGCAVTTIKSRDEIFLLIEKELGVKGFAAARKKLDNDKIPIKEIYRKISDKLCTVIDYKIELSQIIKYYVPNKYVIRLIDIAKCNNMYVTAIDRTSYPREFAELLLKKYKISTDRLLVTSESETDFKNEIKNAPLTAVLSSDYNGFIKHFIKHGCKPFYYRNPKTLVERTIHPELSKEFTDIFDGICGLRLFSGLKRMSREYELSYLCVAPAVFGFAQRVAEKADNGEKVICLCDEGSVFGITLKRLAKHLENITFFPWSALATSKYKTVEEWETIVNEMPVYDYAFSGVFDSLLRYSLTDIKGKQDKLMLARIMATAWIDKSSDGVNSAVSDLIGDNQSIIVADPVAGFCGSADFCNILKSVKPDTIYKCMTMSNYLCGNTEKLKPLANIVQGNKPLLCQIDNGEKKWVYPKKLNRQKLGEIYSAIYDFTKDFTEYTKNIDSEFYISGNDANALYLQGLEQINYCIQDKQKRE